MTGISDGNKTIFCKNIQMKFDKGQNIQSKQTIFDKYSFMQHDSFMIYKCYLHIFVWQCLTKRLMLSYLVELGKKTHRKF